MGQEYPTYNSYITLQCHSELVSESHIFRIWGEMLPDKGHFARNQRFRQKQSNEFSMTLNISCFKMHATNSQVRLQHHPLLISKEGVRGKI